MIYSFTLMAGLFVFLVLIEHFLYMDTWLRLGFIVLFLLVLLFIIFSWILVPFLKLKRIGNVLSYEEASDIIGKHFSQIQDKLLNTLQLIKMQQQSPIQIDLLTASIDQRTRELSVFSFSSVIRLKKNVRLFRYALVPVLMIIAFLVISPGMISEPVGRFIQYNQKFEKPLPFQVVILNDKLEALQKEDFILRIKVSGSEVPEQLNIREGGVLYPCNRDKSGLFRFPFHAVQTDILFTIVAGPYESEVHTLKVYPKPVLNGIAMEISYPPYTGRKPEMIQQAGDISVPQGTHVKWRFTTRDVEVLDIRINDEWYKGVQSEDGIFGFEKIFYQSSRYILFPRNSFQKVPDSLSYQMTVIPDAWPMVEINESNDTVLTAMLFFKGNITDDYGFSRLIFSYKLMGGERREEKGGRVIELPLQKNAPVQSFYFSFPLDSVLMNPGDRLEYFFQVWDNDAVNGPKSARTEVRVFELPSEKEIRQEINENAEKNEGLLREGISESQKIQKSIEALQKTMTEKQAPEWQEQRKVDDLLRDTEQILKKLDEVKARNEQNLKSSEQFLETSERIREKQKMINELMDKLLTEEVREMLREMQELLSQIDKNRLNEMLEKMKDKTEELEKELDRNLSLLKQLEFERKLDQTVRDLREVARKQEELSVKSENSGMEPGKLKEEQDSLHKEFELLRKELDSLQKKSADLDQNIDIRSTEPQQEDIDMNMKKGSQELGRNNRKNATREQKEAARKLDKLAQDLQDMMLDAENEEMEEDLGDIRMLLENLIRLSFSQEQLLYDTRITSRYDPKFIELVNRQFEIKEKSITIRDSLQVIARKQIMIQPVITRELKIMEDNLLMASESFELRNMQVVASRQQLAMTSMNNLALLLDEAIRQMEQQMNSNMMSKGQASCKMPKQKGGKSSMKGMRELQQQLGKQLEKIRSGMEKMKQGSGITKKEKEGMNEEIARLAAMQEAIRRELQKYHEKMLEEGNKDGGSMNKTMEEMEQNERDILNKNINLETINRQQRILTRLLESEKAEQIREQEEKRESKESFSKEKSNPSPFLPYNQEKIGNTEMLRKETLPVNEYFKGLINHYMVRITK